MKLRYKLLSVLVVVYVMWALLGKPSEISLEYLKVFLSWQVVAFIFGVTFLSLFKNEIAVFLKQVRSIMLPGGTEIKREQEAASTSAEKDKKAKSEVITLSITEKELIDKYMEQLEKQVKSHGQEKEVIIQEARSIFEKKQQETLYWFFSYCNIFFIPLTKRVLKYFSTLQIPISKEQYDTLWTPIILDVIQRQIILDVLLKGGMLIEQNKMISVTETGREFLKFIGL